MAIKLDWQRRAVVSFAVALFVLSVILVFFALREAEREKLLKEREIAAELGRTIETISAGMESLIREAEDRIYQSLRQNLIEPDADRLAAAPKDVVVGIPFLSDVFFVESEGQVVFLNSRPLYLLSGEKSRARDLTPVFGTEERWREAEDAEFRLKDYSRAVSLYREIAAKAEDPGFSAILLNRIGRCYVKWGRDEPALAAYREQLRTGSPDLTSDGIPLGITALHQSGNVQLKMGRGKEAAGTFLELYCGLLDARWPLTESQFRYFLESTEDRFLAATEGMDESGKSRWAGEFEDLETSGKARRAETEKLRLVLERIVPRMKLEAGERAEEGGEFGHISEETDGGLLLSSFRPADKGAILGLLWDPDVLAGDLFRKNPDQSRIQQGRSIEVTDGSGRIVAAEHPGDEMELETKEGRHLVFSGGFTDSFPPWTIQIYQAGVDAVEREFRLRRGVYLLTLVAVIAALFLGGYLAIRSTAKELKLARLKSDFVATVSHEFRTPLTSIRYMAELLQRGRVPQEERKQRYYETITGESERLSRLVENLLDFSKIEAGMKEYTMEETDVTAVAAETASRFRQQSVLQEFSLETEIADGIPLVRADRESISRAVFNLLDNAVKYSNGNPRIVLRVWTRDDHVCLQVEDEGVGISKSDQKRIFDKFYRARHATESDVKGSGIGLPLVDHIVRAHGGRIILESEPRKGTRVTIELPVAQRGEKKGNGDG